LRAAAHLLAGHLSDEAVALLDGGVVFESRSCGEVGPVLGVGALMLGSRGMLAAGGGMGVGGCIAGDGERDGDAVGASCAKAGTLSVRLAAAIIKV
jgi:hypothetical protein